MPSRKVSHKRTSRKNKKSRSRKGSQKKFFGSIKRKVSQGYQAVKQRVSRGYQAVRSRVSNKALAGIGAAGVAGGVGLYYLLKKLRTNPDLAYEPEYQDQLKQYETELLQEQERPSYPLDNIGTANLLGGHKQHARGSLLSGNKFLRDKNQGSLDLYKSVNSNLSKNYNNSSKIVRKIVGNNTPQEPSLEEKVQSYRDKMRYSNMPTIEM